MTLKLMQCLKIFEDDFFLSIDSLYSS